MNLMSKIRRRDAGLMLAAAFAAVLAGSPVQAETPIKFSLDWKFEGPAAPFLVAIDKGYFKAEGLDVTIDTSGGLARADQPRRVRAPTTWASATSTR